VAGVTVGALAERARTSKGSMYHFFPDLDAVILALAERHVTAMQAIATGVREDVSVDWSTLSADEVVERIMTPFGRYIDTHPDAPIVARSAVNQARIAAGGASGLAVIAELIESVMRARTPRVPAAQLAARASAMVAILQAVKNAPPTGLCTEEGLRTELRRALGAYLEAAERAGA